MDGPEAVHQVRGARAYIVLVLSLTLKLPFFEQPSNVIFSKRIILLLNDRAIFEGLPTLAQEHT